MIKFVPGAVALLAIVLSGCSGDSEPETLELSAGDGGGAMASCMAFDPAILGEAPVAFEGTAMTVDGERVTLEVDHWYAGGDADEVVLLAPQGLEALIAGFNLEVGKQYLISATNGQVNYCGFSGESTNELRAGFEAAFGG